VKKQPGPVGIEAARALPGLRLIALQGVPSPWSQAAKAILHVKGIPYTLVHRTKEDAPDALETWTGQASFPASMFEDERPRSGWAEILLLAERLAPKPALVPAEPAQRAFCFGVAHEICGEMGLGWCRRLEMVRAVLARTPPTRSGAADVPYFRLSRWSTPSVADAPAQACPRNAIRARRIQRLRCRSIATRPSRTRRRPSPNIAIASG
jgi:hypothetical protein